MGRHTYLGILRRRGEQWLLHGVLIHFILDVGVSRNNPNYGAFIQEERPNSRGPQDDEDSLQSSVPDNEEQHGTTEGTQNTVLRKTLNQPNGGAGKPRGA